MRLLYVALPVWFVAALAHAQTISGPARIVDGDTLVVAGQRVRLHGIDALESAQQCRRKDEIWACGTAATDFLRRLLDGQTVSCEARDRDRYGRIVAVCQVQGQDVNAAVVAAGLALAYRQYSTD